MLLLLVIVIMLRSIEKLKKKIEKQPTKTLCLFQNDIYLSFGYTTRTIITCIVVQYIQHHRTHKHWLAKHP